ncbi:MAG TPA: hypothetical protein VN641_20950 [Urbifossiella sp.]|nr:hypothetical protein [Urbifossiella sp.]
MATIATIDPEIPQDLVDRALQLHPAGREKLGRLLLDSVVDSADARELIHARLGQLVKGEVELLDADELVADLERRYGAENPL